MRLPKVWSERSGSGRAGCLSLLRFNVSRFCTFDVAPVHLRPAHCDCEASARMHTCTTLALNWVSLGHDSECVCLSGLNASELLTECTFYLVEENEFSHQASCKSEFRVEGVAIKTVENGPKILFLVTMKQFVSNKETLWFGVRYFCSKINSNKSVK